MEHKIFGNHVSSIKFPILPPLLTSDLQTEFYYYQKLAIAVEQRLKILAIELEKRNRRNGAENIRSESSSENLISFIATAADSAKSDTSTTHIPPDKPLISLNDDDKTSEPINKSASEENVKNNSVIETLLLCDSVSSDGLVTASTDLNQYLNVSDSTTLTDNTNETPESYKPQVPKTLDIVPITVQPTNQQSNSSKDELPSKDCHDENKPKLVRRGSYVLETPSPMLLAHMQSSLSTTEYSPTNNNNQSVKRKEWSIVQSKAESAKRKNDKEMSTRSVIENNRIKKRPNNIPVNRISKSVSNSKTGSPLDLYQPARSVDCIQAMFAKESKNACKTGNSNNRNYKYSPASAYGYGRSNTSSNNKKANAKNFSKLNETNNNNKLSSSLGNLNSKIVVRRPSNPSTASISSVITRSSDSKSCNKSQEVLDSCDMKEEKPVVTSERIVNVFKEIQETHKKQMFELLSKQQKEQLTMQDNFRKQQIVLLAQIRKAFPEISISSLTQAIASRNTENSMIPIASHYKSNTPQTPKNKEMINGIHFRCSYERVENSPTSCTNELKQVSSNEFENRNGHTLPEDFSNLNSMTFSTNQVNSPKTIDDIPVGVPLRKHSNVSRQLFPVKPKFCNANYTDEHIKAVTKINAYARGFLIRRIMKTEKVISLKNTYKEALHCLLRLHVDAPLNLPELNFHQRLQLQCDAASMNIVDLFSLPPAKQMEIIAHDREVKKARSERPTSARSFSFATQRTLARKKMKELGHYSFLQSTSMTKSCPARTRCQTWGSNTKERKNLSSSMTQGMKRSTSAHAVRKPWR